MAPIRVRIRLTPSLLVLIFALVSMIAPLPVAAADEVDRVGDPCVPAAEVPPPPPDWPVDSEGNPVPPPERPAEVADWPVDSEGNPVPPPERPAEVAPPPPDYPPDCDTSYRAVEIPGVRSWGGSCIDSLAEGPIVLKWKGATEKGVFTLRPSSETEGAITEVLNGKQPGYTFKYQGKGSYRIEVVEANADGSPWLLDVVYVTKGKMKQCVAGNCITSTIARGEAMIPLEAQRGTCPRGE